MKTAARGIVLALAAAHVARTAAAQGAAGDSTLLFVSGRIPIPQREKTRHDLLEYCKRDTFATVRLVERLAELAAEPTG